MRTSLIAAILCAIAAGAASAETITATGTLQMKDAYGTEKGWGRTLVLPRAGKVVRVMDATYGFSIVDAEGETVADFLLPQQAVGFELAAGSYSLKPYVCAKHRHHHVEVTVEY
ncbi:hypothetical protein Plav_2847 [Parvibaculum lavamentivorans DS-1]|uniref:Uncharacterized protein n=1 Tax=Parvibaculum lavamentivorans (strain DS-1 / DSM 13023 / NCIMB 13966) TaxID=402881 RepID=A7HX21_PARL1|nr:hypothetical protein [Parvibaculum lavamentivorans]ABS64454.1 hypothetical protein Plav_2847 [Parvibaculum lavamentivorans DS-1]